jgi:hypothetical protein
MEKRTSKMIGYGIATWNLIEMLHKSFPGRDGFGYNLLLLGHGACN